MWTHFIHADLFQHKKRAFTWLIPPHNWLQALLPLPKTTVACCNCCWRSFVLTLLLEKAVVIMKASFLHKHVQSSRTSRVFSATKALVPFKAAKTLQYGANKSQSCLLQCFLRSSYVIQVRKQARSSSRKVPEMKGWGMPASMPPAPSALTNQMVPRPVTPFQCHACSWDSFFVS